MTTVFIAGSMTIKQLDAQVRDRIATIVSKGFEVVVGGADGVDASIQTALSLLADAQVRVFCSGETPRNNVGGWPVALISTEHAPGSRAFFTAKDLRMAEVADYGLMVWDGRSPGTLGNVVELLSRQKKSLVFVNREKSFRSVSTADDLERLLERMPADALRKANDKIRLSSRLAALKATQSSLFN